MFSRLQQLGTYAAVVGAAVAALSLSNGAPARKLIIPAAATVLAAAVAAISANFRGKLEFQDYRYRPSTHSAVGGNDLGTFPPH